MSTLNLGSHTMLDVFSIGANQGRIQIPPEVGCTFWIKIGLQSWVPMHILHRTWSRVNPPSPFELSSRIDIGPLPICLARRVQL